jgi:RNA polymerase primary sigma factor
VIDGNGLIARVVGALTDDYHRRGGYLSSDHILRAVEKKGLGPEDDFEIRRQLVKLGIEIDEPESHLDIESAAASLTEASDDLVRRYLVEIGAVKLLTADEEILLSRRIEAGLEAAEALQKEQAESELAFELRKRIQEGQEAFARIVIANLRLVVSVAKLYVSHTQIHLLDLVQEGTLGLIRAAQKFDHRKGFKFSTYATWWIRQAVTRAIADKGRLIRMPVHVNEALAKIHKIRRALLREKSRNPSAAEIAEQLGWKTDKVQFLLDVSREPVSLDAVVGDEGTELCGFVRGQLDGNPEKMAMDRERSALIDRVLAELSPRESTILHQRFGLGGCNPMTLEEIGRSLELTRERVRQIESKALKKLQHPSRRQTLGEL